MGAPSAPHHTPKIYVLARKENISSEIYWKEKKKNLSMDSSIDKISRGAVESLKFPVKYFQMLNNNISLTSMKRN